MISDQLISEPPGSAVFQVWGDALLLQGDPRGELVQLSRTRGTSSDVRAAIGALVAKHPEWTRGCERHFTVEFKDGFIDSLVMLPNHVLEALTEGEGYSEEPELPVLKDPISARLRHFSAETMLSAEGNHGCWGSQAATLAALVDQPRPWLRVLELDRWMMTEPLDEAAGRARLSHRLKGAMHEAETSLGSLAQLWSVAPRLEHVVIAQALESELGQLDAPHLRTLCLGSMRAGAVQLESLADARVPELRWLELRLMREPWRDEPIDAAALERALGNPSFAKLEHLALLGTGPREGVGDAVLAVLGRWLPQAPQLRSLDLGGLDASPAAWRALVETRPSLQRVWASREVVRDPEWLQAVLPVEWRQHENAELAGDDEDWLDE